MAQTKIRILYIALEMDLGGLQRVLNLLIRRIDRNKFTPYLCCLDRGGIFAEELEAGLVKTYVLHRKPGPLDMKLLINLYKILKENKIDIIHSQNGCTLYAAVAGRFAGVKGIVHTDHGRLVPDKKTAILEDRLFSFFIHRFVGVSEDLTEYLKTRVKINKKRLITIVNGVDVSRFRPFSEESRRKSRSLLGLRDDEKILGTVCRLDPIKNLEFLIQCMPVILRQLPHCKLLIVGEGPIKDELIECVKKLGLASKVIFTGRLNNVEDVYPAFDLYACTSLSEGTSMTILEAMASGLPIVASDVGGNRRLVDESNGIVFPLHDQRAFTEGAIRLLTEPGLSEKMGWKSRDKVERFFGLDKTVREYEALYQSVSPDAHA